MKWYPLLFLFGLITLMVGDSTQENSELSITATDKKYASHIRATKLGRLRYQDGEVNLFRNQLKPADFFFTPFPQVEPNLTECSDNEFSGRTELVLFVSLYTTDLLESVKLHIKNQNDTCQTENCEISLLPIQSIRIIQRGLQTLESKRKYTLNSQWQSNTPPLQTVQFIIYTSNLFTCKSLQDAITSRCRLSDFKVQYSSIGQQTEVRTLEVNTRHIANTSMYKRIKSQLHSKNQEIVALIINDYKSLLSEVVDQVTMNLRAEEGFESIQELDQIGLLLDSQLQYMQVQLTKARDQLWESLYWRPELTRPDRLAQVLNKLMKQDVTDSDKFRYEYSQVVETMKKNLKLRDRQKFENFGKHLVTEAAYATNSSGDKTNIVYRRRGSFVGIASRSEKINADTNAHDQSTTEEGKLSDNLIRYDIDLDQFKGLTNEKKNGIAIVLERKDAEKLVRYFSEHVGI